MEQALKILSTIGVPDEAGVSSITYDEAVASVPVLSEINENADDFSTGVRTGLANIYDVFESTGLGSMLQEITVADLRRVDQEIRDGKMKDLVSDVPAVKRLAEKEDAMDYDHGLVLAFALAYDACKTLDTVQVSPVEEPEEAPEEFLEEDLPPAEPVEAKPRTPRKSGDFDALLLALHEQGMDLSKIQLKPIVSDKNLRMLVIGEFGNKASFLEIAKTNAIFKAVTQRDIEIRVVPSQAGPSVGFVYEF